LQPVALIVAALLAFVATLFVIRAIRLRRLIHDLQTLDVVPIGNAQPGLALVHGTAHIPTPLVSPLMRKPCAYYFFRFEESRARKKPRRLAWGKEWTQIRIGDASGDCRVEAQTAVVASGNEYTKEFVGLRAVPPEHAVLFERAGIDERHLANLEHFRVIENTIEPGDRLYVTGTLRHENGEKVFYRVKRSPLIVSSKQRIGFVKGLRHELLLFSLIPLLLYAFAALFLLFGAVNV
jgi:hypothetical protein